MKEHRDQEFMDIVKMGEAYMYTMVFEKAKAMGILMPNKLERNS